METSPICLGDEAIEPITVESGKSRKGEVIFQGNRLQHRSILVLLVAKHIAQRQTQSELAERHFDLQFPDAGERSYSPATGRRPAPRPRVSTHRNPTK